MRAIEAEIAATPCASCQQDHAEWLQGAADVITDTVMEAMEALEAMGDDGEGSHLH
jgi:hypothetical protein